MKNTYTTKHPVTGETVTFEYGGKRTIKWATWVDWNKGEGAKRFGTSSAAEHKGAIKAAKSTVVYADTVYATPATKVEEAPAEETPEQEAPATEETPAQAETTVNVDVVSETHALVSLPNRRGGELHFEDGEWLVEDTYGSASVVGESKDLDDAAEVLARHLGHAGPFRVVIAYDF